MNFVVENTGKINVIFLHGWGADYSSFYFLKTLLTNCTLHFANLDGFGGSLAPTDTTVGGYAKRLEQYIIQNNLKNVILVGHSFGGRIAIEYASKNNLLGLVLVDSAGVKPKFSLKRQAKIAKYKFTKWLVKHKLASQTTLQNYGSVDYKNADRTMQKVLVQAVNYNQKSLLKYIQTNTLIVWGSADDQTPPYMAKILNKNIKDSNLVMLENCGHFSFLQKPYQFYLLLSEYINKQIIKGEFYE